MVQMHPSSRSCWVCVHFVFQTSQATRQAWISKNPQTPYLYLTYLLTLYLFQQNSIKLTFTTQESMSTLQLLQNRFTSLAPGSPVELVSPGFAQSWSSERELACKHVYSLVPGATPRISCDLPWTSKFLPLLSPLISVLRMTRLLSISSCSLKQSYLMVYKFLIEFPHVSYHCLAAWAPSFDQHSRDLFFKPLIKSKVT